MTKKIEISESYVGGRQAYEIREPITDKEKANFNLLKELGVDGLFKDLRRGYLLYQRKSVSGGVCNQEEEIKYEPALINYGVDFGSISILFDGTNSTRYEDGGFIRVDLVDSNDRGHLTYDLDDERKDKGIITKDNFPTEIFDILNERETRRDVESMMRQNLL